MKAPKASSPSSGLFGYLQTEPGRTRLIVALFFAAVLIAYWPVRHAGFIWDDDRYVTSNALLSRPDGLRRIWFSQDAPSQYVPLVYTTLRVEYSVLGLHPAGYHLDNVLLHALNAVLLWRLLKRLKVPGDWLAAGIFALHPVQVESVAWISERKNVLSLLFYLLAVRAWVKFVDGEEKHSGRQYLLSLGFCALALFSKATACTLPAALLVVLWLRRKPINLQRLMQIVPFAALGIGMGLLVMWWERHHQGTEGTTFSMSLPARLLIASHAIWFYLGKLIWPANLTFIYPQWTINPANALAYGWLVACVGACAAIYYLRRYVGRSLEVAGIFYGAALAPLLGFIMLYTFRYTYVADHYQYIASIGPLSLLAAGMATVFDRLKKRMPFLQPAVCGALFLGLGTLTWHQAGIYRTPETLWRDTLRKNPACWMAENNLGDVSVRAGQLDDGIAHYHRSLEISPSSEAHYNLGVVLARQGDMDGAISNLEEAVRLDPDSFKAQNNLGIALNGTGHPDEAISHFERALQTNPRFATSYINLAIALNQKGQVDAA
ncbi:MAG TPA: tetratricopeptide repeat protein, partial [Verrucomicrobiae bacterium]|nr:tetratricopeptide repeat protein [Verrucomicrobiae bacterium]